MCILFITLGWPGMWLHPCWCLHHPHPLWPSPCRVLGGTTEGERRTQTTASRDKDHVARKVCTHSRVYSLNRSVGAPSGWEVELSITVVTDFLISPVKARSMLKNLYHVLRIFLPPSTHDHFLLHENLWTDFPNADTFCTLQAVVLVLYFLF